MQNFPYTGLLEYIYIFIYFLHFLYCYLIGFEHFLNYRLHAARCKTTLPIKGVAF